MFISFEGIDNCGKTTQLRLLRALLEERGLSVLETREPGGTRLAEAIRTMLLEGRHAVAPRAELLLFGAARAQHVQEVVAPALQAGQWVLSDRFADSSVTYQGGGLGLDTAFIAAMNGFACAGTQPALTLLFDLPPAVASQRAQGERRDAIEARGLEFQTRVRASYLELAGAEPGRFCVIDASYSVALVQEQVCQAVVRFLPLAGAESA